MGPKKPRHLKAVERVPSKNPKIVAVLEKIVKAIKEHPEEDWPRRLRAVLKADDAKMAAEDASPIYRRARKNKIRIERAGKVRGKKK